MIVISFFLFFLENFEAKVGHWWQEIKRENFTCAARLIKGHSVNMTTTKRQTKLAVAKSINLYNIARNKLKGQRKFYQDVQREKGKFNLSFSAPALQSCYIKKPCNWKNLNFDCSKKEKKRIILDHGWVNVSSFDDPELVLFHLYAGTKSQFYLQCSEEFSHLETKTVSRI